MRNNDLVNKHTDTHMKKKNIILIGTIACAMLLAGCGETKPSDSKTSSKPATEESSKIEEPTSDSKPGQEKDESSSEEAPKPGTNSSSSKKPSSSAPSGKTQEVTINGTKTTVAYGSALTKPADPTAPAGKKFYGWKNTLNGGQIWDFEKEDLNIVLDNVNLEPCFVDASLDVQILEAELCPNINALYGGELGMPGATYSGGQQGKGLIGIDYDGEIGCTGVDGLNAFVHFMYVKGDKLTWQIESSAAAQNVMLFARFGAEYGIQDPDTDERYSSVNQESFPITVNDEPLAYGTIKLHNIPEIGQFLSFQDYYSGTFNLEEGENIIEMTVDNEDTLNGTIASSAPMVDSIKLFSTSTITWDYADYENLERD